MARIKLLNFALVGIILGFLIVTPVMAQSAQDKRQETVYNGEIFDGQGYGGQFYPEEVNTIYVLADTQNVLVPKLTQVYWWAITHEYKADWETLDKTLTGTSLVIDSLKFSMTNYSLQYNGGYDSSKTDLLVGSDADQKHTAYQKALEAYNAAAAQYTNDRAAYDDLLQEWGKKVDDARAKGESTNTIPVPKQPVAPVQPTVVVTTPAEGIPFQVSAGQHQLHLVDAQGKIIPGSQRTLVAFTARRSGIAYKVIAASKYTVPDTSTNPNDTIFVSGEKALYVQPAAEQEYDNFYAAKLVNSQDRTAQDRRGVWTWLPTGAFAGTQIVLSVSGGSPQALNKAPYYVKQTPGGALGYDILPYDSSAGQGVSTFDAFMVVPQSGVMTISAPGVAGSAREIHVVNTSSGGLLLGLAFLPLVVGVLWLSYRHWRTK